MAVARRTSTRDKHRRIIARGEPACGLCQQPIDYTLPHLDPGEFVVDHVIPVALGGEDTIENKQAAHRRCNEVKGARLTEDAGPMQAPRLYVTVRSW